METSTDAAPPGDGSEGCGDMDFAKAVTALGALAQDTRLKAYRLLVTAGPEGMPATAVADALDVRQNLLSSHLAVLARADLVHAHRRGRQNIYVADLDTMRAVFTFLVRDCCSGHPDLCRGLLDDLAGGLDRPAAAQPS